MTSIKRSTTLSLACGALLALALGTVALAQHARVGGGTPFSVPLVVAFNACGVLSPDEVANGDAPAMPAVTNTHVTPLNAPSCPHSNVANQPAQKHSGTNLPTLTANNASQGRVRLDVTCGGVADTPPCGLNPGEQEDIEILIDPLGPVSGGVGVICVAALPSGPHGICGAAGAGFHGVLLARSTIRITDHSNGTPPNDTCTNNPGIAPCVTGTVTDIPFVVPLLCGAYGGSAVPPVPSQPAGTCRPSRTTINNLKPGTVKELQRGNVEILNVNVLSPGNNLNLGDTTLCPPTCGDGDEEKFLSQGIFLP